MFALEIKFATGGTPPELLFLRRASAVIGAGETAQVVIDDLKSVPYQLQITRELGARFRCKPVGNDGAPPNPQFLEAVYEGQASFKFGAVTLYITALDTDLLVKEGETPDRCGVRVLRQSVVSDGPLFPALVAPGPSPFVISFSVAQPVLVGRAKACTVRLDDPEVEMKHARIGYENGDFWVEDLGSSGGTFTGKQQIAGRSTVPPGVTMRFGTRASLIGVTSEDQLRAALKSATGAVAKEAPAERRYPAIVSVSEVARPARLAIPLGGRAKLGRDPASEMWLGAPHVSRLHVTIAMSKLGEVTINDHSTNGTRYDGGILRRGDSLVLDGNPRVLDFGGGITVAVCFDQEQERAFLTSKGSPRVFNREVADAEPEEFEELDGSGTQNLDGGEASEGEVGFVNRFAELSWLFRTLSTRGKVVMLFTFAAVMAIVFVVATLLRPLI